MIQFDVRIFFKWVDQPPTSELQMGVRIESKIRPLIKSGLASEGVGLKL